MASKPLPRITCNKCNKSQDYRGQHECLSCGQRLNNWSVASQLRVARDNQQLKSWEQELEEDDGA